MQQAQALPIAVPPETNTCSEVAAPELLNRVNLKSFLESLRGRFVSGDFTKRDRTARTLTGRLGVYSYQRGGRSRPAFAGLAHQVSVRGRALKHRRLPLVMRATRGLTHLLGATGAQYGLAAESEVPPDSFRLRCVVPAVPSRPRTTLILKTKDTTMPSKKATPSKKNPPETRVAIQAPLGQSAQNNAAPPIEPWPASGRVRLEISNLRSSLNDSFAAVRDLESLLEPVLVGLRPASPMDMPERNPGESSVSYDLQCLDHELRALREYIHDITRAVTV